MSEQIDVNKLDGNEGAEAQLAREIASDQWLRVSPIAILYFFVKTLFFLVNHVFIYLIPVFAFNLSKLKENPILFASGAATIVLLVLIASIIKYAFYFYRLSEDRVEIRQGMIKKSHMDLPFGKIQNVKIIQPFYYRFSNFSIVELDTAGSAKQEANIVAIRLPMAESFKQKVQAVAVSANSTSTSFSPTETVPLTEILLNTRSIKDLVIHGVTNNRVWIFLGFLAPFYNAIAENVGSLFANLGLDIASYLNYETQTIGIFILHLLTILMVIILFIVLFSILGSIFVFYDFRLSRSENRYIRRSGLLTKHEISMKVSRIQRAVQQQDWLDILIGRVNVKFEQNSAGAPGGNQAGQMSSTNKLIIPSVTPLQADDLVQDVFNVQAISQVQYKHVSPRYILRLVLYPCLPIIVFLVTFAFAKAYSLAGWLAVAAIISLLIGACVLRWYRWGYSRDGSFFYIRKGFFGRDYFAFPISKMQQTGLVQTPFMRANKIATFKVVLASGGMTVPYMPAFEAAALIDLSLLKIARDKPAWM
ncbi:PH domain-containing protein [Glaciecola sp. SC05]|uniref:PH domain-containing protein n=1 Tax=Glaciecola sp. SC05 TaxID=1987355 RepID=UPI0035275A11